MSFIPPQNIDQTAFGETSVAELTPEVQISAVNGLRDDVQQLFAGTGSSVAAADNNYEVVTGTDPIGFSSALSERLANYRNGQGLLARFTALFPSSAALSIQLAGLINGENALVFGYNGTEFGLARAYNGAIELQTLEVTTSAGGSENATVTVNGIGYTVPLTSGSEQHNAIEISDSLNSQVPNYTFTANDVSVEALSAVPVAQGSFAFTSSTAVAAWTQNTAGAAATFDWVAQADWDTQPSFDLDPAMGNVFQIRLQYLGYGGIKFYVEDPVTANFELVHTIKYANAHTVPSVNDPSFRVGWAAQNLGNTTSLTVKGASAGAFVEGKKVFDERGRTLSNSVISIGSSDQEHILSVRNRSAIANKANRTSIYPRLVEITGEHNKAIIVHIDIGATFDDDVVYQYLDEVNSVAEVSTSAAHIATGGREIATLFLRGSSPLTLDINKYLDVLLPREALTISAIADTGSGAELEATIVWVEDP